MLLVVFEILIIGAFITFFISTVFYMSIIEINYLCITFINILIMKFLEKITRKKISDIVNKKNFIISAIISIVIFMFWYFFPRKPILIKNEDIAYVTVNSYISENSRTYNNKETIEYIVKFLEEPSIHRTINRFSEENVKEEGFTFTFYNDNKEIIKSIQISKNKLLKIDNQYYKTYFLTKENFDEYTLQQILNEELAERIKKKNANSISYLRNSVFCQNNILSFSIPEFSDAVKLKSIRGITNYNGENKNKQTVYFLKDELNRKNYKAGDTVTINLNETIGSYKFYELEVTLEINNIDVKIDIINYLPKDIRIKEK